jgi:nucleotide-binding universal stress UspA family protein
MILLAYDGSESAKHAIRRAHEVLGHLPATVLHVWNPPVEFVTPDPFGGVSMPAGVPIGELEKLALHRAESTLAEGVAVARETGFTADGRLEEAERGTWRKVLHVADDIDAEVIVVGSRGLSTAQSALIGSISNALLHHAKRMLLVVPRDES